MIYTRYGQTVNIIADAGLVPLRSVMASVRLVQVQATDDPAWKRWRWAETLKSDEQNGIYPAADSAPKVTLTPAELKAAKREAA